MFEAYLLLIILKSTFRMKKRKRVYNAQMVERWGLNYYLTQSEIVKKNIHIIYMYNNRKHDNRIKVCSR